MPASRFRHCTSAAGRSRSDSEHQSGKRSGDDMAIAKKSCRLSERNDWSLFGSDQNRGSIVLQRFPDANRHALRLKTL
jgi:hypothetical protein